MKNIFSKTLKEIKHSRRKGKKSILQEYYGKFLIYKWDINGKSYIGLTTNLKVRIKNYLSNIYSNHYICRTINKYDDNDIIFSILCYCSTIEELKEKEKQYIIQYNTLENGYNLTSGGDYCIVSEETKEKMSNSQKNKKSVYFYNVEKKEIELEFNSINESARYFNCNPTTIFASLRNNTIFKKLYKISYKKDDEGFVSKINHKNKQIMKGNKNSIKYTWTLIFDNGKIFKKDSLIELRKCCPEIKESSFRRIAENKMKDITKYSFKIIKENK